MKTQRSQLLIPDATRRRMTHYLAALRSGSTRAGGRLQAGLEGGDWGARIERAFLDALLNTKLPQIFAESAVVGDGSDWNAEELGILGDISIALPVTVFDDGRHRDPIPHADPFTGTLVFTPGALLRNGMGQTPADWTEVVDPDGSLNADAYYGLYERRLLPVFRYVDAKATQCGQKALITLPGLGCGQFAGPFQGRLGAALQTVLERFLEQHGESFSGIRAVYFDPYNECVNTRRDIHGISFLVRPLLQGNEDKPQLCHPTAYEDPGDDFSDCYLTSIVAWDHVSWPGNDFFAGSRCTDDGVKAAATDSMRALTSIEGHYDRDRGAYLPPEPHPTWEAVVRCHKLKLIGA